jgi:hypothetical protein
MHFLIKWAGYDAASDSTWEPINALTHCQDMLRKYCEEQDLLFLLGEGVTGS